MPSPSNQVLPATPAATLGETEANSPLHGAASVQSSSICSGILQGSSCTLHRTRDAAYRCHQRGDAQSSIPPLDARLVDLPLDRLLITTAARQSVARFVVTVRCEIRHSVSPAGE